jgi:hypothetical protein
MRGVDAPLNGLAVDRGIAVLVDRSARMRGVDAPLGAE